jgi:serine/threonine protein phosphatase PrpC
MTLASAGHPFACATRPEPAGTTGWSCEGDILNDRSAGKHPVPWFDARRYELDPGDILVLVSDGLTEGTRLDNPYGYRFERLIQHQDRMTAQETAAAILHDWTAHPRHTDATDDATIVVAAVQPLATVKS